MILNSNLSDLLGDQEQSTAAEPTTPQTPEDTTTNPTGSVDMDSSATSDFSEQPRHFRSLDDIYAESVEVELVEELLLMGIDEQVCFEQAITSNVWKEAMENEINSIKKNNTW